MFFRKIFGAARENKPGTQSTTASRRNSSRGSRLSLGRRSLRLEPLEDRRMLSITLFVDGDSSAATPDGLAWATAYPNLQSALDRAAELNTDVTTENDVTQIWIAEGTYYPTSELDPSDPLFASFRLLDGVAIYGGFIGTETALEERVLSEEHATILSGDLGVAGDKSDNAYTVVYCPMEVTATIDGLGITGGHSPGIFDGESDYALTTQVGGGIYSEGDLTVVHSTIYGNEACGGAGMVNDGGVLTVQDTTVKENLADSSDATTLGIPSGGGVYNNGGTLTLFRANITQNYSYMNGGGLFNNATATIEDSSIHNNEAMVAGGGLINTGGQMSVINTTVLQNVAAYCGGLLQEDGTLTVLNSSVAENKGYNAGGMLLVKGTTEITNTTVVHNVASNQGGGIFNGMGQLTMNNSLVALNKAPVGIDFYQYTEPDTIQVAYNLIGNGEGQDVLVDGVNGNQVGTAASPIDPMLSDWAIDDNGRETYHLLSGSPALNAGNNALAVDTVGAALTTDQLGAMRIQGYTVDIGAVEGAITSTPGVTYVVTSFDQTIAHDGVLTFLEAYRAATENQPLGDAPAGSWSERDTIQFARKLDGTFTMDEPLQLYGTLTIEALGDDSIHIQGNLSERVIEIASFDADIVLRGLTVTGGYVMSANGVGYSIGGAGGGITNWGTLLLDDMTIRDNQAETGGGIFNMGNLIVTNSKISSNQTLGHTLDQEDANGRGAGIHNIGSLHVANTLFTENLADGLGGGIMNEGQMVVTNSTLTMNRTLSQEGAGIYTESDTAELYNTIVADNRIWNTGVWSDLYNNVIGSHNLISVGSDQTSLIDGVDGNQVGTAETPLLPDFANPDSGNFRLGSGSPAVDKGSNTLAVGPDGLPLAFDLNQHPRNQNDTVDIGAYEYGLQDWGTVRINQRNRTDTYNLTWTDEWSGSWVEIWASGNESTGIGGFDIALAYKSDYFIPDMDQIVPGSEVDGASMITFDEEDGVLRFTGVTLQNSAGQGSEVLIAKVYFKPTPGQSALPRDTDGKYLTPVFDAGFYVAEAELYQADSPTTHVAQITPSGPLSLWPVMYDLNSDSIIDMSDILHCLGVYQFTVNETAPPEAWASDFDRSGYVDMNDVLTLLSQYLWQKGDGTSVSYPDEFPYYDSNSSVVIIELATILATPWEPSTNLSMSFSPTTGVLNSDILDSGSLSMGSAILSTNYWQESIGGSGGVLSLTMCGSGTSMFTINPLQTTDVVFVFPPDCTDAVFESLDEAELFDLGLDLFPGEI